MNSQQCIPVFVISLARSQERRQAIIDHLRSLSINFDLIDAVDGLTLTSDYINSITSTGVNLHPGAIGCYLSHVDVYKKIVEQEIPVSLILEDDARLNPVIVSLLRAGVTNGDFDYCFLDCDDHNDCGPVFYDLDSAIEIGQAFKAFRLSAGPQTTHAYLISYAAAAKRLDNAFPIMKPIDLYDHLPYPIKFYAIVSPKAAWVSEHSLESYTSSKKSKLSELSHRSLRRWPLFYKIRDWVKLKPFLSALKIRQLKKEGKLAPNKRWRQLPFGREILLR